MNLGHERVRPLLAARSDELSGLEAKLVAEHLTGCEACAAEAATYRRLLGGLAAMAQVELEPPADLLDRLVATVSRRRSGALVVAAAAGSAGALVATVVVARVLHQRRRTADGRPASAERPRLPAPAALLATGGDKLARAGRWPRRLREAPA
jgi:predicted anti-sigma-YlaC factor YlaD